MILSSKGSERATAGARCKKARRRCLADDQLLHTEGPDAVPAMNIMVNAIIPILKWTSLEVYMIKSHFTGINHATGTQVATDSITLNGQSFTT